MKEYDSKPTSTRENEINTPFSNHNYCLELESTEFCNDDLCTVYHNLIRILRWTCELSRIDLL